MTDAQTTPIQKVWNRSKEDPDFRNRLIADPRSTLLQEMGLAFPEDMDIEVVENTASKMVIALPAPTDASDEEDLDDVVGFGWCYHVNWLKDPNLPGVESPIRGLPTQGMPTPGMKPPRLPDQG